MYSKYQARAKVTAGLAEMSAMKVPFEDVINQGDTPDIANVAPAGTPSTTHCALAVTGDTDGGRFDPMHLTECAGCGAGENRHSDAG